MKKITELNQKEIMAISAGISKLTKGVALGAIAGSTASFCILSNQKIPSLIRIPLAMATNFMFVYSGFIIGAIIDLAPFLQRRVIGAARIVVPLPQENHQRDN